jgi:hypothetical protein
MKKIEDGAYFERSEYSLLMLFQKVVNITCPASISVWNFLAETPEVVNIEAPFPYLLEMLE